MGEGAGSRTERNSYPLRHGFAESAFRDFRNAVSTVFLHVVLSIKLVVIQSWHKVNAFLNHYLDRAVVKVHAVLDRFHTGIYAVVETLTTKGVTRNFVPFPMSLIHDRIYFFRSERWRDNHFPVIGEIKLVCRIQLDPICPMRDLIPYGFAGGPGRVHHLQRRRKRHLVRVTVHNEATRCLNATGRNLHSGTLHNAVVDGVTQIHIAVHSAQRFEIAKRCEACHHVFLRVRQCGQCAVLVGIAQDLSFQVGSVTKNMCVRVDQAGKHGGVTQVHHIGARRHFHSLSRTNLGDAVPMDQNDLIVRQLFRLRIKKPAGANCDPVVRRRRLSAGEGAGKEQ